jgi:hypothetical protein
MLFYEQILAFEAYWLMAREKEAYSERLSSQLVEFDMQVRYRV